jgi:hypothetical protein
VRDADDEIAQKRRQPKWWRGHAGLVLLDRLRQHLVERTGDERRDRDEDHHAADHEDHAGEQLQHVVGPRAGQVRGERLDRTMQQADSRADHRGEQHDRGDERREHELPQARMRDQIERAAERIEHAAEEIAEHATV